MFSDVDNVYKCFVGELGEYRSAKVVWRGDEIVLETKHGLVKLLYDDETEGSGILSGFRKSLFG